MHGIDFIVLQNNRYINMLLLEITRENLVMVAAGSSLVHFSNLSNIYKY